MTQETFSLTPAILSGGSGTRLWPLSRPEMPKQFLPLVGEDSMLLQTLARTAGLAGAAEPILIANSAHADLIESQFPGDAPLILEPAARNTAPAVALAALAVSDPTTILLVMPSDHVIADVPAFHAAIAKAAPMAADGWLVTLGISPDSPETGYGYIALGEELTAGVQRVARFVEKPDLANAEAMLAAGNHVWNAGIFLFRADAYLAALGEFRPDMLAAVTTSFAASRREGRRILPDKEAFAACPSDSIDYAVMEKAANVACVPVDMGWSDVGSWDALHAIAERDALDNAVDAHATLIDARGCLVRSDGPRISVVGVDDLIVVATESEVMIVRRGHSQLVKKAAEAAAAR